MFYELLDRMTKPDTMFTLPGLNSIKVYMLYVHVNVCFDE